MDSLFDIQTTKQRRRARRMSQKTIAKVAGLSLYKYRRRESGRAILSIRVINLILDYI